MKRIVIVFILSLLLFSGCTKKSYDTRILITNPVSIKKFDTPKGADPSVSAELGGAGFKGGGWQTNNNYEPPSSSSAVKGGGLVISIPNFPVTMSVYGKGASSEINYMMNSLMYESLLELDDNYENFVPRLASHWKISSDNKSYWFRINPDARFADGQQVTAEDVIATYDLCADKTNLFPIANEIAGMFLRPVAESKYIVKFTAKVDSADKSFSGWKYFYYAAGSFKVHPASYLKNLKGSDYNENYSAKYIPGSGPYLFDSADIVKENYVILRRRSDYWAEKEDFVKGLFNFDFLKFEVVQNEMLNYEKFKKGEIDVMQVFRASDWVDKMTGEEFDKGLILKKEVFNKVDNGPSGICLNMRQKPLDDIRVRKALCYAYNRQLFNTKLFYNSYLYLNSYYPGSIYQNLSNPVTGFNLDSAKMLLTEAGWTEKNSDGFLVKDGKELEFTLPFRKGQDRYFTIYKEDLAKLGINLNLRETDAVTIEKLGLERNFNLIPITWNAGDFPTPEIIFSSSEADVPNSTNWTGIKDKTIDSLTMVYNNSSDIKIRVNIIQQIDSIAMSYYQFVMGWYPPAVRIAFQNKFGFPEGVVYKKQSFSSVLSLWYYEPSKAEKYWHAKDNAGVKLDKGEMENKYWLSH